MGMNWETLKYFTCSLQQSVRRRRKELFYETGVFQILYEIHRKTTVMDSLFKEKKLGQVFSCV